MCIPSQSPGAIPDPKTKPETADYVAATKKRETAKLASATGIRDTVLTSPLGLQNPANIQKKTLLGG